MDRRYLISYTLATLSVVTILSLTSCGHKESTSSQKDDFRTNLFVAQTQMWYNSATKIRLKQGASKELDSAVLTNYFPMYLGLIKFGESKTNIPKTAHFRFAAKLYAENDPKISDGIWNLTSSDFDILLSTGRLESFGFDSKDLSNYEKFRAVREAYFDDLKKSRSK